MGVSKNNGTPKSSILIYFNSVFHYKTIHFGVPLFLETPIWIIWKIKHFDGIYQEYGVFFVAMLVCQRKTPFLGLEAARVRGNKVHIYLAGAMFLSHISYIAKIRIYGNENHSISP